MTPSALLTDIYDSDYWRFYKYINTLIGIDIWQNIYSFDAISKYSCNMFNMDFTCTTLDTRIKGYMAISAL